MQSDAAHSAHSIHFRLTFIVVTRYTAHTFGCLLYVFYCGMEQRGRGLASVSFLFFPLPRPRFPEAAVCSLNGLAAAAAVDAVFVGGGGGGEKTSDVMSRDSKCRLHCRTDGRTVDGCRRRVFLLSFRVCLQKQQCSVQEELRRGIE